MNVTLVNAVDAARIMASRLGTVGDRPAAAEARRLIALFHGRHIGIPPAVALRFAKVLAGRRQVDPDDLMRAALHARLLEAVGRVGGHRIDAAQLDFLPRSLMVEACLLPLASLTAERLGETVLFASTDGHMPLDAASYDRYEADFGREIDRLVAPPSANGVFGPVELLWERTAHRLWSSVQRSGAAIKAAGPAATRGARAMEEKFRNFEPDGMALRFICGLEPDVAATIEPARIRLDLVEEQNPLMSHPRQGGVVDIHTTRLLEDIEDIVPGELIYPLPILLDKILNEGFLAKKRPPPLDEYRPVLVVGACVDRMDRPAAALAKVAWLDAVFRFAIVLYKAGLNQSQIRFAEWLSPAGAALSAVTLSAYPVLEHLDAQLVGRNEMRAFFRNAGWLPGFVSRSPTASLAGNPFSAARAASGIPPAQDRLNELLHAVAPELGGVLDGGESSFRLAIAAVFGASDPIGGEVPLQLAGYDAAIRSAMIRIVHPPDLVPGEAFIIESVGGQRESIPVEAPTAGGLAKPALEQLSATLSGHIFDQLCEGLDA